MHKSYLLLLFGIGASLFLQAQCPGPIVLATQADVDAFPVNWPNCTNPTGRFVIGADPTVPLPHPVSNITSLAPLSQITGFGNHTYIYNNPLLTTLDGLHNVTQVIGDFTIQANNALTDLTGLGALTIIQDLFKVENNNNLQSLDGMAGGFTSLESLVLIENDDLTDLGTVYDNLQTVDEYVYIQDNASLAIFSTMNNLTSIGQYLNFENHPSLTTLNGFGSLETVGLLGAGWDFEILDCPSLTTLDNFANLSQIGKNFEVAGNTALTSMSFPSLTSVNSQMIIESNASLTSLLGLEDFTLTGPLTIFANPSLPECEALGICQYLDGPGFASIGSNALGCNSIAQVEAACLAAPVELIFFNGKVQDGEVLLTWETASEQNNDYFQIEHSTDGSAFQPVGKVAGRGSTASPGEYSYLHTRPAKGSNYYRFKQVDFDGRFAYSNIVHVDIGHGLRVEAYPNPTSAFVKLKGELSEGTARLLDINGRPLIEKQLPNGRLFDLTGFSSGIFLLEIVMGGERIVKRIVKE